MINVKSIDEKFSYLKQVIDGYGYDITYSTFYYVRSLGTGNAVDHGRKTVITMPMTTIKEIIGICHEIGHIKDRFKTGKKRNRKNKSVKMYEEVLAWIYAAPLLMKCRTPFKLTVKTIFISLFSHLKC